MYNTTYKKKKKNKIWIILAIILLALIAGGAYWYYYSNNVEAEENANALPELEQGQEYIYVRITSILGNEMTATIYEDDRETDNSETWLIPVGTDVVTKLGTTTSFSRLASGDYIRILVQNESDSQDILKIWIVN
jgi:uncharacterized protein YpmB